MKYFIILLFCINSFSSQAQEEFDGHKWEAPYHLPQPEGWGLERFLIPINFAPSISYKGVEDIRFTPGWAKVKSDEYWTYAFLWYLDGKVNMDEKIIAENLKAYYTGLFNINTTDSARAAIKVIPATAVFNKATTVKGDIATYTGTIEMMNYLQLKPITLNCMVHIKNCTEDNKTIVFYELSPQPFSHSIWVNLNQLWSDFRCKK